MKTLIQKKVEAKLIKIVGKDFIYNNQNFRLLGFCKKNEKTYTLNTDRREIDVLLGDIEYKLKMKQETVVYQNPEGNAPMRTPTHIINQMVDTNDLTPVKEALLAQLRQAKNGKLNKETAKIIIGVSKSLIDLKKTEILAASYNNSVLRGIH